MTRSLEAEELLARARRLGRGELAALAGRWDRTGEFPTEAMELLRHAGLLGLPVPASEGGPAGGLGLACQALEEIGAGCPSTALILTMHWVSLFYLGPWCEVPDEEGERRLLAELQAEVFGAVLTEGALVANCYGEPGSGTNIGLPFTRAAPRTVRVGESSPTLRWVLNGRKLGTLAPQARYLQMHAVAAGGPWHGQVVQFMLPSDLPGVRMEALSKLVGVRAAAPVRVLFEDCVVPERYRFGPPGMFGRANVRYPYATLLLAAPYLGLARSALEQASKHMKERQVQGLDRRLCDLPGAAARVGQLVVDLESARSLLDRAARLAVPSPPAEVRILTEASKVAVGETALAVAMGALQLGGTRMLMEAMPLERLARDALAAALHPPTTPEALEIVGRLYLGLEPFAEVGEAFARSSQDASRLPEDVLPGG